MWNRPKELKNIISFQMINYYHLISTGLDYISIFMVPVRKKLSGIRKSKYLEIENTLDISRLTSYNI